MLLLGAALLVNAGMTGRSVGEVLRGVVRPRQADNPAEDTALYAGLEGAAGVAQDAIGAVGDAVAGAAGAAGAAALVDGAAQVAAPYGTTVVSAYRPGDDGDHGSNDGDQAARDIGQDGVDAHVGPPTPKLDRAAVAVGAMFGRRYQAGQRIVDTFNWKGYRVQIIWRTPAYGGHMGHIHVGIRKL